jgi:hypothetical protein
MQMPSRTESISGAAGREGFLSFAAWARGAEFSLRWNVLAVSNNHYQQYIAIVTHSRFRHPVCCTWRC